MTAQLSWLLAGSREREMKDFLPEWDAAAVEERERKTQTPDEMIAVLRGIQRKKRKRASGNHA
jgi:hypothetical protein